MARPVFKLFGMIGMKGLENVKKDLTEVDKWAKQLEKSLNKTSRKIAGMGKTLSTKLTAPILGVAGSLTLLSKETGDYADKLLDLEQITGLTVENLQKFELIAGEAGVSFEGLVGTIGKFQKRLPQIIEGKGRAAEAMQKLGINAKDTEGNLKDINILFPQMIAELNKIEDITERNVTAQELFGKSLNDLAPVLSMSADDLNRIAKEAEDMGIILDKDALNAANNFRVSMEKLQAQFTSVFRVIATKFIPVLNNQVIPLIKDTVIPVMLKFGEAIGDILEWFNSLSPEVKRTSIILLGIAAAIGPVLLLVSKLVIAFKTLVPWIVLAKKAMLLLSIAMAANPVGAVITLVIGLVTAFGLLRSENEEVRESFEGVWGSVEFFVAQAITSMRKSFFEFARDMLRTLESVSSFIPSLSDKVKEARRAMGQLVREERIVLTQRKRIRKETELNSKANDELKASIDAAKKATADLVKQQKEKTKLTVEDTKLTIDSADAAKRAADEKKMFEEGWTNALFQQILNRKQLLDLEYREAINQAEQLGSDTTNIELFYSIERLKIAEEEEREKQRLAEETARKRAEQESFARDVAIQSAADILGVISQFYGVQIAFVEKKKQEDIAAAEASIENEEMKAAAIKGIEARSSKEIRDLKRKQAIADKANAIFSIALNTAIAITNAFAQLGPIGGAIAAAVIGTISAAQIALVASKPIPLAEGGLVKKTQGGVNTLVGEGGQDELVLPLETGVAKLAESLAEKNRDIGLNGLGVADAAGFGSRPIQNVWKIGTLVADDAGLKELERRSRKFRVEEDLRRGLVT